MQESGFPMSPELETLIRIVYLAGYNEAVRHFDVPKEQK